MAMLKGNYLITTLIKRCILSQNIEGPPGNISYNKMTHKMLIYVKIEPWGYRYWNPCGLVSIYCWSETSI